MAPMGRTNIEIDDALIERVMQLYGLRTKREAVEYALMKMANQPTFEDWEKRISCMFRGWFHLPGSGGQSPPRASIASAMTACGE